MEIELRQRLIGAVVLAALVILLLPAFFKGQHQTTHAVTINESMPPLPTKPAIETNDMSANNEEVITANNNPAASTTIQTPTPAEVALGQQPVTPTAATAITTAPQPVSPPAQASTTPTTTTAIKKTEKPITSKTHANKITATTVPVQKTTTSNAKMTAEKMVQDEIAAAASSLDKKTSVASPIAQAWVVQLGSFADITRAKTLVQELKAKGITGYTKEMKTNKGKQLMRVFVGPETNRSKAEAIQKQVAHELQVTGVVVDYNPLLAK